MTNIQTIAQMASIAQAALPTASSSAKAAYAAEDAVMAQFRDQRYIKLSTVAVHIMRAIHRGDKNRCLDIMGRGAESLNADADAVNILLTEYASLLAARKFKKWSPKLQSSIVQRVRVGEGTDMKHGDFQYEGFEGEDTVVFLQTLAKENWARMANNAILGKLTTAIEYFYQEAGPIELQALYMEQDKIEYKMGKIGLKAMFRILGSLSRGHALFERDAIEESVASDGMITGHGHGHRLTTARIEKMRQDSYAKSVDDSAIAGDHYAQEADDEIVEAERQLDVLEAGHRMWPSIESLVLEYNLNGADTVGFIPLPTADLEARKEYEEKSLMDALLAPLAPKDVVKMERLKAQMDEARRSSDKALNALFE